MVSSSCAVATKALFLPRRAASLPYLSLINVSLVRLAAQAHSVIIALVALFPWFTCELFLPALSLFPGLTPAVYLRLKFRNLLLETRYAPADCLQHELVALGKASLHGIADLFLAALQPPAGHAAPCPG